jgi:hypothetical protein
LIGLASALPLVAVAQTTKVDYIEITPIAENYCGTRPQGGHRWILGGGACLTLTAAGGTAGLPSRHEEQMVALAYNDGPNGVREHAGGDDISLGSVPVLWSLGTTANESHTGVGCLTDSPLGLYANNANQNARLATAFDLSTSTQASLEFWHRWNLGYSSANDVVAVHVRLNGGAWQTVDTWTYTCGFHSAYIREVLNLTPYVGNMVEIRFNITTSASSQSDGWFIDDLILMADGEALFADDFETGTDGWVLEGAWGLGGNFTSVVYPNRSGSPVTFPVGTDQDGRPLATISGSGLVHTTDTPVPTGQLDGVGYVWIRATHSGSGSSDGIMGRVSAAAWIPE